MATRTAYQFDRYETRQDCPTPCLVKHPRCKWCGWLLRGERAASNPDICRYCEIDCQVPA